MSRSVNSFRFYRLTLFTSTVRFLLTPRKQPLLTRRYFIVSEMRYCLYFFVKICKFIDVGLNFSRKPSSVRVQYSCTASQPASAHLELPSSFTLISKLGIDVAHQSALLIWQLQKRANGEEKAVDLQSVLSTYFSSGGLFFISFGCKRRNKNEEKQA